MFVRAVHVLVCPVLQKIPRLVCQGDREPDCLVIHTAVLLL